MRTAWMILAAVGVGSANGHLLPLEPGRDRADASAWQISMSPEYYRGGGVRQDAQWVEDGERGRVLRFPFAFADAEKSETVFITRTLEPPVPRLDITAVRFRVKLSGVPVDAKGGFILRLRSSDTEHENWDVQQELGQPFPLDRWVEMEVPTAIGSRVRNVWQRVFGSVRQITFRLDDVDGTNGEGALLLDGLELVLSRRPATTAYVPRPAVRPTNPAPRVLLLKHRAAGFYDLEGAVAAALPGATCTTLHYRGLHFGFFDFPASRGEVLAYDAIVMLNIDPFILTSEEAEWIADAVHAGSGLLVYGGSVTLTAARTFPEPLRALLPVAFETGASGFGGGLPQPGDPHPLNQGFDPAGLGVVGPMQDLQPIAGAAVPWRVGERPLVVAGGAGKGRTAVVNAQLDPARRHGGDWFTAPLADDLQRRLLQWVTRRLPPVQLDAIALPPTPTGGGSVRWTFAAAGATLEDVRVTVDSGKIPVDIGTEGPGRFTAAFGVALPAVADAAIPVRVDRLLAGAPMDWRDFAVRVQHPLDLQVVWPMARSTFAPGSVVEADVRLLPRGLPTVQAGARVETTFSSGWGWTLDSLADVWVVRDGATYHDLGGPAEVTVEALPRFPPAWQISGILRATRPVDGTVFGTDGRVARCERTVAVQADGSVDIRQRTVFLAEVPVHRMPVTLSLPAARFGGLSYQLTQADGRERAGAFPLEAGRETLFDGTGCDLRIETPEGILRLVVTTPGLRVWGRDLRPHGMRSYRIEIEAPCSGSTVRAGDVYDTDLRLSGPGVPGVDAIPAAAVAELQMDAVLVDPSGGAVWTLPAVERAPGRCVFRGELPNLASGAYRLEASALAPDGQKVVQTAAVCHVVDPLERTWFYPIMSVVGFEADGHWLDPAGVRERIDDLLARGFNTAAITGMHAFLGDPGAAGAELRAYAESYAQQRGMATTFEYSRFTTYDRNGPLRPCPFAPGLEQAVAERLGPAFLLGNRTPRLLTAKVIDEPTMTLANLDFCTHCRDAFRERYGMDYAEPAETDPPYRRWATADFMAHALDRVFAAGAAAAQTHQARFDLLLTYMATGLGYQQPLRSLQDATSWSRHVRWADFDIYPYFYPRSQRLRMVQAGFGLSAMQDIGHAYGIPWGFYVELDDRNWPFQQNPKEATAECAFTAVAHGADYLNTFINRVVGTGSQARPERWDLAGEAFRLINRCGPLLTALPACRSGTALYYPDAHEFVRNGYDRPDCTLAFVKSTYGQVDVRRERLIVAAGKVDCGLLIMLRTAIIHTEAVPILRAWIEGGGTLVTDALPERTERDAPVAWALGPAAPGEAVQGESRVGWGEHAMGRGRVILLDVDIESRFAALAEAEPARPEALREWRQLIAGLVDRFGPRPPVRVAYRETAASTDTIEAGLRAGPDGMLLTVVSHQPEPQAVEVTVALPWVGWLVDMGSGAELQAEPVADGFRLAGLRIPGRGARMVAGWRRKPGGVHIAPEVQAVRLGDALAYTVRVEDGTGQALPGGVPVQVEVRDAADAPVSRFGRHLAPVDGTARVSVPVPRNAAPGIWHLTATLIPTGQVHEAAVEIVGEPQ